MASSYFKHDAMGRLAHWQLPDGNKLAYHYLHGELSGIDLNSAELTRHQMVGGLEMRRSQGTLTQQYEYDEQGRLTALRLQRGKQIAREWRYGYDRTGNLLQVNDSVQGEQHYSYDPLDRLLEVRGELTERFMHDPAGNLLGQTQGAQFEPARTQGNRLLFSGDRHFDYDEFGRLAVERRGKGQSLVTRYEYDCQHQLIAVELPDGSTARYDYDAFGRRIRKTVSGQKGQDAEQVTEFLWQANNLLAESRSNGVYRSFIYEPGSFKPLVQLEGEGEQAEVYHYQLDHLGTPLALTHHDGHTAWQVRYRAYGNVWKQELAEVDTPLRFQGQYFDAETGLHYNRHRYYQPDTGRFITPDPIGLAGGLNNYQYAPNPTGWVDPLGLSNVPGQCPLDTPRTRIPVEQQDVFKQFEQHHTGQFNDDHALVSAFENVRDNESPWPVGFTPKSRIIEPGERFNMALGPGQPSTSPGGFGTMNNIETADFVWHQLAVKQAWKPAGVDRVATYEVTHPFEVLEGPVGPQIEKLSDGSYRYLPGGASQLNLRLSRNSAEKMNFLQVVEVKEL